MPMTGTFMPNSRIFFMAVPGSGLNSQRPTQSGFEARILAIWVSMFGAPTSMNSVATTSPPRSFQ